MDVRAQNYVDQVDRAFREACGVSYSKMVGRDLEKSPLAPRIAEAYRNNLAPSDFRDRVVKVFGLKTVRDADALPHNRRVAALVAFAADNADWSVANNGSIYRDGPNGIERLSPEKHPTDRKFGFAAYMSPGGAMEVVDGEVVALTGDFEAVAGGIDIDLAIGRMERRYAAGMSM